jgi:hypothetical protein
MKLAVYNAIAAILGTDDTLEENDKERILDVCRNPTVTEQPEPSAGIPTLLTQQQVAEMLQVHPTTVRRWEKQGSLKRLAFMRHPRYRLDDIERLAGLMGTDAHSGSTVHSRK